MTFADDEEAFLSWGWRVPFLASVVAGVRRPLHPDRRARDAGVRQAASSRARSRRRRSCEVLRAPLARGRADGAPAHAASRRPSTSSRPTSSPTPRSSSGFDRSLVLSFVMVQALVSMCAIPYFGHLSDVIGRRRITAIGCVVMMVFPFIYFGMLDTRDHCGWCSSRSLLGLPMHDLQYGPQAAFIAERFPGSLRYSGASLGYQLASITAGGPAPIVALYLYQTLPDVDGRRRLRVRHRARQPGLRVDVEGRGVAGSQVGVSSLRSIAARQLVPRVEMSTSSIRPSSSTRP